MRIMVNGPPVNEFDSLKYAKEWIGASHLGSDTRGGGGIIEQSVPNPMPREDDEVEFKNYRFARAAPFL